MKWRYCFPHTWDQARTMWEDVYLLPDDPHHRGPGIHLTVVALGDPADESLAEGRADNLARLGDQDYVVDLKVADMYVRADDFSRTELLDWTRVFLRHIGIEATELVAAPPDFFVGKIAHADLAADLGAGWAARSRSTPEEPGD